MRLAVKALIKMTNRIVSKRRQSGRQSTGALNVQRYLAHRAPSVPRLGLEDGEKGLTNQDCKVELQVRRQSSMVCQILNQYFCHSSFVLPCASSGRHAHGSWAAGPGRCFGSVTEQIVNGCNRPDRKKIA